MSESKKKDWLEQCAAVASESDPKKPEFLLQNWPVTSEECS